MATILKLGPADHGQPLTLEEFHAADWEEGCQFELIDGRLYVTHEPDPPQNIVEIWLFLKVSLYSAQHPEVINFVTNKARVYVPGRRSVTNPEPDLAAYADFPLASSYADIRWQDESPMLVGEVLSPHDPDKDLVRNVSCSIRGNNHA